MTVYVLNIISIETVTYLIFIIYSKWSNSGLFEDPFVKVMFKNDMWFCYLQLSISYNISNYKQLFNDHNNRLILIVQEVTTFLHHFTSTLSNWIFIFT